MKAKVSIITVNYYSEEEILQCYRSVIDKTKISFELILVSNSPIKDDFRNNLLSLPSKVLIKETGNNLGFAKACNLGSELATGDFLFFLNPDTRFINDVLSELIKCYDHYEQPGILGPKTFNESGTPVPSVKNHLSLVYFFSLMIPLLNFIFSIKYKTGHYLPAQTSEVPVLNGHALFIKKMLFKIVNGMEEKFFMYWEENDLCLKVKTQKKQAIFCNNAKLIHKSGTSTRPYFINMEIEKHRSQKKFILKHYPSWNFLNRISGCIGYSWRTIGSLFTFDRIKIAQFWNIFIWYCFRYN